MSSKEQAPQMACNVSELKDWAPTGSDTDLQKLGTGSSSGVSELKLFLQLLGNMQRVSAAAAGKNLC